MNKTTPDHPLEYRPKLSEISNLEPNSISHYNLERPKQNADARIAALQAENSLNFWANSCIEFLDPHVKRSSALGTLSHSKEETVGTGKPQEPCWINFWSDFLLNVGAITIQFIFDSYVWEKIKQLVLVRRQKLGSSLERCDIRLEKGIGQNLFTSFITFE